MRPALARQRHTWQMSQIIIQMKLITGDVVVKFKFAAAPAPHSGSGREGASDAADAADAAAARRGRRCKRHIESTATCLP